MDRQLLTSSCHQICTVHHLLQWQPWAAAGSRSWPKSDGHRSSSFCDGCTNARGELPVITSNQMTSLMLSSHIKWPLGLILLWQLQACKPDDITWYHFKSLISYVASHGFYSVTAAFMHEVSFDLFSEVITCNNLKFHATTCDSSTKFIFMYLCSNIFISILYTPLLTFLPRWGPSRSKPSMTSTEPTKKDLVAKINIFDIKCLK